MIEKLSEKNSDFLINLQNVKNKNLTDNDHYSSPS